MNTNKSINRGREVAVKKIVFVTVIAISTLMIQARAQTPRSVCPAGYTFSDGICIADPASTALTLATVASRFGKSIGRNVIWHAPYGAAINVESEPQPLTIEEFVVLIQKSNKRMAKERPEWAPLAVCVFENAVIVRTVAQPECGKPLN